MDSLKPLVDDITKLLGLLTLAVWIGQSDMEAEDKYNLIFSRRVSGKIFATLDMSQFDYYDPDATYEADVLAFVNACERAIPYLSGRVAGLMGAILK